MPRSGADTKNPRLGGQIGKHRTDKQVQRIAHGRELRELFVVCPGVDLVEEGSGNGRFRALHNGLSAPFASRQGHAPQAACARPEYRAPTRRSLRPTIDPRVRFRVLGASRR